MSFAASSEMMKFHDACKFNDEFIGDKNSRFKVDFLLQLEGIFMNFWVNVGSFVFFVHDWDEIGISSGECYFYCFKKAFLIKRYYYSRFCLKNTLIWHSIQSSNHNIKIQKASFIEKASLFSENFFFNFSPKFWKFRPSTWIFDSKRSSLVA